MLAKVSLQPRKTEDSLLTTVTRSRSLPKMG